MKLTRKSAWLIIILFTVFTVFFGYYCLRVNIQDDITTYVPKSDPYIQTYDRVAETFNLDTLIICGVEYKDAAQHLKEIDELTTKLKNIKGVNNVLSLTNAPRINSTAEGDISVGNISSSLDLTKYDITEAQKTILSDTMLKGKFISEDGNHLMMVVSIAKGKDIDSEKVSKEIQKLFKDLGTPYHLLGTPTANMEIEELVKKNLSFLIPIVSVLVIVILFLSFRTVTGVLLPIITVAIADIWTVGVMQLVGAMFNITSALIPVIIIGIGTAYAIHILNRYYEELHKGLSLEEAIQATMKGVGTAVFLSAFTTIAGFLSLLTADIKPVWQLGIYISMGLAIALVAGMVLVPSIILITHPKPKKHMTEDGESVKLRKFGEFVIQNRIAIVASTLIVVFVFAFGIPKLTSDSQIENFLNDKAEMVKSSKYLRENFGGNNFIFIDMKAEGSNNFKDFYLNRSIRDMESKAKTFDIVSQTTGIGDVVAKLTAGFTGTEYVPGSNAAMEQNYMLIEGSEGIDQILKTGSNDTIAQVMVNTKVFTRIKDLNNSLNDFNLKYIYKEYTVSDFDLNNTTHAAAYKHMLEQFVEARNGKYSDNIANKFIQLKKETLDNLFKKVNKEEVMTGFNKYLETNGATAVDASVMETLYANTAANQELKDYFEAYKNEKADSVRAKFAYDEIKVMNLGMNEEATKELAQYVNDTQVAISGGTQKLACNVTGVPIIANVVNDLLFANQKDSIIWAYVMVLVLFTIFMRSFILGLFSLIPITLTIVLNFGFMGLTGLALNAATITIASITIGSGIDYSIHYLNRFRQEYRIIGEKREAAIRTLATCGRAIIINSAAVVLGFLTFGFSNIGLLQQFGLLTAFTMTIAPVLTFLLFPIIMALLPDKLLDRITKESTIKSKAKKLLANED